MSAQPVDVLAVMDSVIGVSGDFQMMDVLVAREAVAELIEAAEAVRDAPSPNSEDAAIYLLELALARVQGGQS